MDPDAAFVDAMAMQDKGVLVDESQRYVAVFIAASFFWGGDVGDPNIHGKSILGRTDAGIFRIYSIKTGISEASFVSRNDCRNCGNSQKIAGDQFILQTFSENCNNNYDGSQC